MIDGSEAHGLGLVNHVVDQTDTGDAAFNKSMELAEQIILNVRNLSDASMLK